MPANNAHVSADNTNSQPFQYSRLIAIDLLEGNTSKVFNLVVHKWDQKHPFNPALIIKGSEYRSSPVPVNKTVEDGIIKIYIGGHGWFGYKYLFSDSYNQYSIDSLMNYSR